MEIHSVLPEERARTEKGDYLPWGYRYADSARNARQPEESGPFGRNRSIRHTSGRRASTRQGTTPVRQKENTAVAEFGRLFAKEQVKEDERRNVSTTNTPGATTQDPPRVEPEAVPTECLLYGYASKASEWKVISKFERIVAPSIICEDYPREDPNLYLNSASPLGLARSAIVVHRNLSKEALRKSRVYRGGQHWIKITFDSYQAAERACFFSPVEIDGCLVHCEMWAGKGPMSDVPLPKGSEAANLLSGNSSRTARTLRSASGTSSAIAGFEKAMTLPRSHTMPDEQFGQPGAFPGSQDDVSVTSATASSATAHEPHEQSNLHQNGGTGIIQSGLRSRSTPQLPSQRSEDITSQYMTHIPNVRRAILRPMSEALPPQPSFVERVFRSIPIVSWLFGMATGSSGGSGVNPAVGTGGETAGKPSGTAIAEGPILKDDDGTWDRERNGWYWSFWWGVDRVLGTDFCGLKED